MSTRWSGCHSLRLTVRRTWSPGHEVSAWPSVNDLDAAYRWCQAWPCEVTSEPRDEPYGDRVFEFLDPEGYLWEVSQPVTDVSVDAAVGGVRQQWFGTA